MIIEQADASVELAHQWVRGPVQAEQQLLVMFDLQPRSGQKAGPVRSHLLPIH